mmetsp:Transcript_1875/g.4097  ORF Transcript_1875/g.4097 Transcript_1875/m.4097 type:complete len:437 (+) Transcript_1875:86-1396(+)
MAPKQELRVLARPCTGKAVQQRTAPLLRAPATSTSLPSSRKRTLSPTTTQPVRAQRQRQQRALNLEGTQPRQLYKEVHEDDSSEAELLPATLGRKEAMQQRSIARYRKYWRQGADGSNGGPSMLEQRSVTPGVRQRYERMVTGLQTFATDKGLKLKEPPQVDEAIVQYMHKLFFEGADVSTGTYLLVGYQALHPQYSRTGELQLPRSVQALKGWKKLSPPRSRVATSAFVVSAIAAELTRRGLLQMALWVLLGFGCYLRPASNLKLRRGSLLPPVAAATSKWGLLLHPSEYNERSKTGTQDDSLLWDNKEYPWLEHFFPQLCAGDQSLPLWDFGYPELTARLREVTETLQVSFVPYQLRHAGPSWDRLKNYRSLAEVQKRGLWQSFRSVVRYEKHTVMLAAYRKLPAKTRHHCEEVHRRLQFILQGSEKAPSPPTR